MFRTFLAAAAAMFITSHALAGTMVADRGSVEESEARFDQRITSAFLMPMQPMTYAIPYDVETAFMQYRYDHCADTKSAIDRYTREVTAVTHENIFDTAIALLDLGISAGCIVDIVGEDVEFGNSIHHKLVLSPDGDHVFTVGGNIPWKKIGTTSFRYYAMEFMPEQLLFVGIKH